MKDERDLHSEWIGSEFEQETTILCKYIRAGDNDLPAREEELKPHLHGSY